MMPVSSPHHRSRLWMPILTLMILMGIPVLWMAAFLLVINPVRPPLTEAEIQATAQYLWDNPQLTPQSIDAIYLYSEDNLICVDMSMFSSRVHVEINNRVVFNGSAISGSASRHPDAGYLGATDHVCFSEPKETSLAVIRVRISSYFVIFPAFKTYEWAFNPEPKE